MLETIFGYAGVVYQIIRIAALVGCAILIGGFITKRIKCKKYFEFDRDVDWYPMNIELDFDWEYQHIKIVEAGPTLEVQMSRSAFRSCYDAYANISFKPNHREIYKWNVSSIEREIFNSDNENCAVVAHIPYTGELYSYDKRSGNLFYEAGYGGGGGYGGDLLANVLYQADSAAAYMYAVNKDIPGYKINVNSFKKAEDQEEKKKNTHKEYHCCVPVMVCSKEYADSFDPEDRTEFVMYIVDENDFNKCIIFYADADGNRHMEKMPSCLFKKLLFDGLNRLIYSESEVFMNIVKAKKASTYRFMKFFSCRKSKF